MKIFLNRRLLITRPLQDSLAFSKQINQLNKSIKTICSPLFEIENFVVNHDLSNIGGLIITSSNALRSLKKSCIVFSGPVFCVGKSTALLAQSEGYHSISSNGNTSELRNLIKTIVVKSSEKLIYFRGEETIGKLGEHLRNENYSVEEVICYRKVPVSLSKKTIDAITSGVICGATFFSIQTVNLFFNYVKYIPDDFVAFCISKEVCKTILSLYPDSHFSVRTANSPTMNDMCKLVVEAPEFAT